MNSLMSYGSDDELDDSPEERNKDPYGVPGRNYRKPSGGGGLPPQDDTNYDEVQMSLSEDSDAESKSPSKYSRDREERRSSPRPRDARDNSQRDRRDDRPERDRYASRERNEDRSRRERDDDDKIKNKDEKDDRTKSREDDKNRDRYRDRDDDKRERKDDRRPRSKDRERYNSRDDRYRQDRDRRRSRSPRDSRDRDRRRSRSPRRSRSRSRDRSSRGGFQRRFDRGNNRMDKNVPRQGNNPADPSQNEDTQNKDRFFMPGITGRFRDQIEKRKLLWQKKEPGNNIPQAKAAATAARVAGAAPSVPHNPNAPRATKVWESTTFAQDTDGKVVNKFKRLMGIKTPNDGNNSTSEVLKKQDEMFSAMEQQYEVARTTTHTMRGVGLGFSSFNR